MGRKKKRKSNNNLKNLGLGALIATLGIFGYLNYVDGNLNFKLPSMDILYKHKNNNIIIAKSMKSKFKPT